MIGEKVVGAGRRIDSSDLCGVLRWRRMWFGRPMTENPGIRGEKWYHATVTSKGIFPGNGRERWVL